MENFQIFKILETFLKGINPRVSKLVLVWYYRDVTTVATGATAAAPKFSDTLTLSQPRGQILPTIAEVAVIIFPWLPPWVGSANELKTADWKRSSFQQSMSNNYGVLR